MSMLLAVGHGSRDPRAAATTEVLMDRLRDLQPDVEARTAWLDHSQPTVAAALERAHTHGERHVVVVPLLLTEAYHTRVDLPAATAAAASSLPGLEVVQAPALGPHPLLLDAAERRLREAGQTPADPRTAVVLAAAGSSDASALAVVQAVAAEWSRRGWWAVAPAYASASGPTVSEAVAELRRRGAPRVAVSPYVLAPGTLPDRIVAGAADADVLSAPLGVGGDVTDLARVVLERYGELCSDSHMRDH